MSVASGHGMNTGDSHGSSEQPELAAPPEKSVIAEMELAVEDGIVRLTADQRRAIAEEVGTLRSPRQRRLATAVLFHVALAQGETQLALRAVTEARLEYVEYLKSGGAPVDGRGRMPRNKAMRSRSVTVECREEIGEVAKDMETAVAEIVEGVPTFDPRRKLMKELETADEKCST